MSVLDHSLARQIESREEVFPIAASKHMIKTYSKIVGKNELFGSEAMLAKNYKRKQNAVAVSEHALVLELTHESFDLLVKEQVRRDRTDLALFVYSHLPSMSDEYNFTQVTDKTSLLFSEIKFRIGACILQEGYPNDKIFILREG